MALPHTIPQFVPRMVVTAADHMEPLRLNQRNLDDRIGSVTTASPVSSRLLVLENRTTHAVYGNTQLGERLTDVEATVGDTGSGNAALDDRLITVETRTTDATTGNTALGGRVSTVETRTTDTTSGNSALDTRVSTLETRTTDETTGNAALGSRVTALEADSGGTPVVWPLCTVRRTAAFVLPSGSGQAIPFDTEDDDSHDMHAAGSALITIPDGQDGVYECFGQVRFTDNTSGTRGVYITLNGDNTVANSITALEIPAGAAGGKVVTVVARRRFVGGDVLRVRAYQDSGTGLDVSVSSYGGTSFSVMRVR